MINWRYDGIALRPACRYDRDGAYSGSAIEKDGKLYLYYTGNVMHKGDYDYITQGRTFFAFKARMGRPLTASGCL